MTRNQTKLFSNRGLAKLPVRVVPVGWLGAQGLRPCNSAAESLQ